MFVMFHVYGLPAPVGNLQKEKKKKMREGKWERG